jgi:pimeloyl-ACP methyl ester carboxylesterase
VNAVRSIATPLLDVAYLESGPADGIPVLMLHGFPYDVRAYDRAAELLAGRGARVIVPYLRGYGGTGFRDAATMRSGQQAALAQDAIELMDALGVGRAILVGYDWGGRAATIVAALAPERVIGLVAADGYNVHHVASAGEPGYPLDESRMWYQYYFQTERGRAGLERYRRELTALLWRTWSPEWAEAEAAFAATAPSFDNPDFVEVVIHSYRVRHGLVAGDPRYDAMEAAIAERPAVTVPSVILAPLADGLGPPEYEADLQYFTGPTEVVELPGIGHNVPQEAPQAVVDAVASLFRYA